LKIFEYVPKRILIAVLLISMLVVATFIGYENFIQQRDTVVRQQQEHLLTIAKSVSRGLDAYINNKVDGMSLLSQNPLIADASGPYEEVIQAFYNVFDEELESVALFDGQGRLRCHYPAGTGSYSVNQAMLQAVLQGKQARVTKEYPSGPNQFSVDILQPVMRNGRVQGVLVTTVNLNKLYNSLIFPIRPGKMGYAMVKNKEGVIIMHPVAKQVGLEALEDRKEKFPDYNWKELEELYKKQVEEEEGCHVYHSNWWQDDGMKWSKKINAFTTIKISDIAWIISVQMDYSEIEQPIKGTLLNTTLIAVIITAFLLIVAYIIFKMDKKRKALELETKYLKELNKTWEELLKSEERLRHSQKLQTIGTLTSGIAHEFNNLLTPILGYSEILLQSIGEQDSMGEDLLEIRKSALRAKEIIQQILIFSRSDGGTSKTEPLRIDLVARESIKMVKHILPNNIKIVEHIGSKAQVSGNTTQLQQVLINLYTNSYHAMKEKGGLLELAVDDIEDAGGKAVRIRVQDTGRGMDKETMSQIFDPFFTTKGTGEGTGLGLSVVHGIVKAHGGSIEIDSEVGIGTTVTVCLPAINSEALEELHRERLPAGRGNILIVDDNAGALKMLEKGLRSYGYDTISANEGASAMRLFDERPQAFDIILMDYAMPSIRGIDVAKHIKLKNPKQKILLVSGYLKEDLMLQKTALFDDYILKPIVLEELVRKIQQELQSYIS
jgi:two-component system cell cycle sensor histidine kinase/response regulator CckA